MPPEFPRAVRLDTELAEGALAALDAGDTAGHDASIVAAAQGLKDRGCELVALAQFSVARAAPRVRELVGLPVLTTVERRWRCCVGVWGDEGQRIALPVSHCLSACTSGRTADESRTLR